jgi:hypothetical protein
MTINKVKLSIKTLILMTLRLTILSKMTLSTTIKNVTPSQGGIRLRVIYAVSITPRDII